MEHLLIVQEGIVERPRLGRTIPLLMMINPSGGDIKRPAEALSSGKSPGSCNPPKTLDSDFRGDV
jgi:hypothetical protein